MRVTVLTGGATAERAVAFASASQIVTPVGRRHDSNPLNEHGHLCELG